MSSEIKAGQGPTPVGLLKESDFCALLGIGERKFKELRAAGVIDDPIELGPRAARWTYANYLSTVDRLPRRTRAAEPENLAVARRQRIDQLKRGGAV